jgi:hypothetical protein
LKRLSIQTLSAHFTPRGNYLRRADEYLKSISMPEDEEFDKATDEPENEVEEAEAEEIVEVKEEIRIKDFSAYKKCIVCGEMKIPYIELEVNGAFECTCRDCYEKDSSPKVLMKCPSCSTECEGDDHFCWKCGARMQLICPTCGSKGDTGDKYCRQCGGKM